MNSLVLRVIAQHVADVLTEEALDALAELLDAIDVALEHAPRAVRRVRWTRLELPDLLLDLVVPRHVGHEILDRGEGAYRLDGDRLPQVELTHPRHAHQPRIAVDLGRARAALAGLAVPPHRQVRRLLRLDLVDDVEHHHAVRDLRLEGLERAVAGAVGMRPPDLECRLVTGMVRHYWRCSSKRPTTRTSAPR